MKKGIARIGVFHCRTCEEGWTCVPNVAANNDKYVNYDNFFYAMLTSMQVCTLDYWEVVFNSVS